MFFHLSLLVHLYDLQHHQSLSETMFHLQAKQLHASFVHAHFHLNDAADVIIDHIEAQCLHPSPLLKLSLYKKLLDMTLHPHHHLPDLWHLQFDLQFEHHLSNLLPGWKLILQRAQTPELSDHQPLPNRLKNLRLPSCQTLSTPMSTKLHQMIPMLARTSPLRRHHINLRYATHFSWVQTQYQNFLPLTPWSFKPESLCPRHVILRYHHQPSMNIS